VIAILVFPNVNKK